MQTQAAQEEGGGRSWLWAVVVAALIRVPVAFIADDQWGDAPIRFDLVTRWIHDPGIWWSFDKVFQYGPLPTHLTGLLALTGLGPHVASRVVVVLGGVAGVYLLAKLAARFGGGVLVVHLVGELDEHVEVVEALLDVGDALEVGLAVAERARDLLRLLDVVPEVGRAGLFGEPLDLGAERDDVDHCGDVGERGAQGLDVGGGIEIKHDTPD